MSYFYEPLFKFAVCAVSGLYCHLYKLTFRTNLTFILHFQNNKYEACLSVQLAPTTYLITGSRLKSIYLQSKSIQNPVNLFHKSSNAKRKGNFQIKEGHVSLPVSATCDCVCTCGDPVPPKPVRRVMFSDDMCAGCGESAGSTSSDRLKSLPIFPPPPPHPSDHPSPSCSSSSPDCCSCREDEIQNHESAVFDSGAANSHYKSPHEVDGEYSYAYR